MSAQGDANGADSSSSDDLDDLEILDFPGDVDWSSTLVLRCDPSAGPYHISDVIHGLHELVRRNEVFNLGQTCLNHAFTISFRTAYSLENFLKFIQGNTNSNSKKPPKVVKVKGRVCTLTRVPSKCVTVTVRNIPLEVDSCHIVSELARYGTVVKTELVKSNFRGWFHVYTNERKISLMLKKDVDVQDLPYGLEVKGLYGSVYVEERNPKCLECYHSGHKVGSCENSKCILYEPRT